MNTKYVIRNGRGWYLLPQKTVSKISKHYPVQCVIRAWDTDRVEDVVSFDSISKALIFLHREFSLSLINQLGIHIHQENPSVYIKESKLELVYVGN